MRTKIPYNNFEALDNDIREILGEDLYDKCEELRNKPSKHGFQFTRFIKKNGNRVQYHFTQTAHMKVSDYIFSNRDSPLWDAYIHQNGQGYKMEFLLSP